MQAWSAVPGGRLRLPFATHPRCIVRPDVRGWRTTPPPRDALAFHASFPGYAPTPLVELPALAAELGVGRVVVKD
jgi:diaminopropionate ammonia-lyase